MAKTNDNILEQLRQSGLAKPSAGYKVPEGYFESFSQRMEQILPERPEITREQQPEVDRTFWQKIRPYVYMAAMFAGIWLMLNMFTLFGGKGNLQPVEQNAVLAKALSTDEFLYDNVYNDMSAWDLVDDMLDAGELEEDWEVIDLDEQTADFDTTYILP